MEKNYYLMDVTKSTNLWKRIISTEALLHGNVISANIKLSGYIVTNKYFKIDK